MYMKLQNYPSGIWKSQNNDCLQVLNPYLQTHANKILGLNFQIPYFLSTVNFH